MLGYVAYVLKGLVYREVHQISVLSYAEMAVLKLTNPVKYEVNYQTDISPLEGLIL